MLIWRMKSITIPVSYTHLDVYKRQRIAIVAVIDGTGFTRLDAGADDGGKDADDE